MRCETDKRRKKVLVGVTGLFNRYRRLARWDLSNSRCFAESGIKRLQEIALLREREERTFSSSHNRELATRRKDLWVVKTSRQQLPPVARSRIERTPLTPPCQVSPKERR